MLDVHRLTQELQMYVLFFINDETVGRAVTLVLQGAAWIMPKALAIFVLAHAYEVFTKWWTGAERKRLEQKEADLISQPLPADKMKALHKKVEDLKARRQATKIQAASRALDARAGETVTILTSGKEGRVLKRTTTDLLVETGDGTKAWQAVEDVGQDRVAAIDAREGEHAKMRDDGTPVLLVRRTTTDALLRTPDGKEKWHGIEEIRQDGQVRSSKKSAHAVEFEEQEIKHAEKKRLAEEAREASERKAEEERLAAQKKAAEEALKCQQLCMVLERSATTGHLAAVLKELALEADSAVLYFVDNSELQATTDGLGYRHSKNFTDKVRPEECADWGSYIDGIEEGAEWLRVPSRNLFLPIFANGKRVLRKSAGDEGESIRQQQVPQARELPAAEAEPSEKDVASESQPAVAETPPKLSATSDPQSPAVRVEDGREARYFVDNGELQAQTDGLGYRNSKEITDKVRPEECADWGSYVNGIEEGAEWVRVPSRNLFLPVFASGKRVLRKCIGDEGKDKAGEGAILQNMSPESAPTSPEMGTDASVLAAGPLSPRGPLSARKRSAVYERVMARKGLTPRGPPDASSIGDASASVEDLHSALDFNLYSEAGSYTLSVYRDERAVAQQKGGYTFDKRSGHIRDDGGNSCGRFSTKGMPPAFTIPEDGGRKPLKCITVTNSEIMVEIQKPTNSNAFFVLPSQLNGAEYQSFERDYIVKEIDDYQWDNTGGPRGQLAVHPAAGQFVLDNAASDIRPDGISAVANVIKEVKDKGHDFELQNGYLKIPDAGASKAVEAWRSALKKFKMLVMENVPASGLTPDKAGFSAATHCVNLVYASAVPVQTYNNGYGDRNMQIQVAATTLIAQYYGALAIAARRGKPMSPMVVYLMPLGGGVFENPPEVIVEGMSVAMEMLSPEELKCLDVHILTFHRNAAEVQEFKRLLGVYQKLNDSI